MRSLKFAAMALLLLAWAAGTTAAAWGIAVVNVGKGAQIPCVLGVLSFSVLILAGIIAAIGSFQEEGW